MSFRTVISSLIPASFRKKMRTVRAQSQWKASGWPVPAPHAVKMGVLKRYSTSKMTWVETGTWMGDTTSALSAMAFHVHTIEPQLNFVNLANIRFKNVGNVSLHYGTSEQLFGQVLNDLNGEVAFWLDGHFSAGGTFEGDIDTPILSELDAIKENLHRFSNVSVFVDDFRCFDPSNSEFSDYPERKVLVDWATANGFLWTVEHDIFVATRSVNLDS